MCRKAVALGLSEIAFAEHVDYMPADPGYQFFRPAAYLEEIARCRTLFRDQITILAGVEIGECHRFPSEVSSLLSSNSFDLVLGSIHWVGDLAFFDGSIYKRHSVKDAWRRYFLEVEMMCRSGGFDVLAHLDLVKRYSSEPLYDAQLFEPYIRPVLESIIQQEMALEINTSTLFRPIGETCPAFTVLQW